MKYLALSLIYVAFFGLIGFAVYFTHSALPLFALFLTPSFNDDDDSSKESNKESDNV